MAILVPGSRARGSRFRVARRGSASVGNLRRSSPGLSSTAVAGLLCWWYAPAMLVLCACYAGGMRLLCACYAPAMRPLCARYAPAMRLLCGCYAAAMLVYAVAGVCLVVGPLWGRRNYSKAATTMTCGPTCAERCRPAAIRNGARGTASPSHLAARSPTISPRPRQASRRPSSRVGTARRRV